MKILNLIIKQKYFDAIMDGRKTSEQREINPMQATKYITANKEAHVFNFSEHAPFNADCVKYDAIIFYVGYNKDRDCALVKVKNAYTEPILVLFEDEKEPKVAPLFDDDGVYNNSLLWLPSTITFELGEIVQKQHKHRAKEKAQDYECECNQVIVKEANLGALAPITDMDKFMAQL